MSYSSTAPSSKPSILALVHDIGRGDIEYVRIADQIERPGKLLSNRTITVSRGGTVDIVAHKSSGMGYGRVTYSPGLRAMRKLRGEHVTYRFSVPRDARPGTQFVVGALGSAKENGFEFFVRVS